MEQQKITSINKISTIRRIPRLGKIRLGVKRITSDGKEYPHEVDYFVVPSEVAAVYGDKPKELPVMLPVDDVSVVFPHAYTWYGDSAGLKCKGNGIIAYRQKASCTGDCNHHDESPWHERKCPCKLLTTAENRGECSLRGHLMVLLPEVNLGGVYQIDTGSYASTIAINSGIDYVKSLIKVATGVERIALIPLTLERVETKITVGSLIRTHYPLRLTCNMTIKELADMRHDVRWISAGKNTINLSLPEPEEINPIFDTGTKIEYIEDDSTLQSTAPVAEGKKSLNTKVSELLFTSPEDKQHEADQPDIPSNQELLTPAQKRLIRARINTKANAEQLTRDFADYWGFTISTIPKNKVNDVLQWIDLHGEIVNTPF